MTPVQRDRSAWRYGLGSDFFERLDELGELGLVGKRDLEPPARDATREAGDAIGRCLDPAHELRVEPRSLPPRLRLCAGPPGGSFGGTNGQTLLDDRACELPPA